MNRALAEHFMRVSYVSCFLLYKSISKDRYRTIVFGCRMIIIIIKTFVVIFQQLNMDDKNNLKTTFGNWLRLRGKLSVFRLILGTDVVYVYTLFYFISFILYFDLFPCNKKKSAEVCL